MSKSGRVKIDPDSWFRNAKMELPVGYKIEWKAQPMSVDSYTAPKVEDASREQTTTLAQGLRNGRHRLEIAADAKGAPPIQAVRVFRPPVK